MLNCKKRDRSPEVLSSIVSKRMKTDFEMKEISKSRSRKPVSRYGHIERVLPMEDVALLPPSYIHLLDQFTSLDCVVNKMICKRSPLSFEAINKVLRQMNKHNFKMEVFGQILFVFPESFLYTFENKICDMGMLRIAPNLKFGTTSTSSPRKSDKCLSLGQLLVRKNTFRERLLNLVRRTHDDFLVNEKNLRVEDVLNMKNILRWSSDFDLTTLKAVPSITFDKNSNIVEPTFPRSLCQDLFKKDSPQKVVEKSLENAGTKNDCRLSFGYSETTLKESSSQNISNTSKDLPKTSKDLPNTSKEISKISKDLPKTSDDLPKTQKDLKKITKDHKNLTKDMSQTQLSFCGETSLSEGRSTNSKLLKESPRKESSKKESPWKESPRKETLSLQKQRLPFHLKSLVELFVNTDKAVHSLYCRGNVVYLSVVLKTVSVVNTFQESHFGQLISLYPEAYSLRWGRVLDKITSRATSKMDLIITPQLRKDGTCSAMSSPEKGFLKFDHVRLQQRSQRFLESCSAWVDQEFQRFQASKQITHTYGEDRPFNLDLDVAMVTPSALPPKPALVDSQRVNSIKDMFSVIKQRHAAETATLEKKVIVLGDGKSSDVTGMCKSEILKSIPQRLLDKIAQNKLRRHLFAKDDVGARRRRVLENLPRMVVSLVTELKNQPDRRPVPKDVLVSLASREAGVPETEFDEYITLLHDLAPGYLQTLDWSPPCLKLGNSELSLADIKAKVCSLLLPGAR